MNDENKEFEEYKFRVKRTEKEYNNLSKQKIIINSNINENCNIGYNEDNNNNNVFLEKNKVMNINSYDIFNENPQNKYPNFQSFLQIHPKDDIEIPSIKYYNYIFNIGSPTN